LPRTLHAAATCTGAIAGLASTGPQHLIAATAAEIHPVRRACACPVIAETLLHARIVVSHPVPVLDAVLPVIAIQRIYSWAVYVDVVVVPVEPAAPIIPARRPAAKCIARSECEPGRD
jgi:hypothetical protein